MLLPILASEIVMDLKSPLPSAVITKASLNGLQENVDQDELYDVLIRKFFFSNPFVHPIIKFFLKTLSLNSVFTL